ncbi:hypothetical protein [Planococcus glaciei]|uniref:hypothetical protein n=1 Tax=Planococcus glaciei TaxID=459472 RepID=UPI001FD2DD8F|nr:hypothetical protein [Planococcus glaciei]
MSLVNRRYSASYEKRYRHHVGRIYQKRYFAKEVDSRLGILTVSSYIHRNPVETKVAMVARLKEYPYSSFSLYWDDTLEAPAFWTSSCCGRCCRSRSRRKTRRIACIA